MPRTLKYPSRLLKDAHEIARGLHEGGVITDERMAEFDALCLQQDEAYSPERIRALRKRFGKSQAELAERLGISVSTLRQWELGKKSPSALANTLLSIIDRQGLDVVPQRQR